MFLGKRLYGCKIQNVEPIAQTQTILKIKIAAHLEHAIAQAKYQLRKPLTRKLTPLLVVQSALKLEYVKKQTKQEHSRRKQIRF